MSFLGLYTKKEAQEIKNYAVTDVKRQLNVDFTREKNKLITSYEIRLNCLRNRVLETNKAMRKGREAVDMADKQLKSKDSQIYVLKTFLKLEYDKEIKRLEAIANRTKKEKIKKKCENRIIDYKARKLAYE